MTELMVGGDGGFNVVRCECTVFNVVWDGIAWRSPGGHLKVVWCLIYCAFWFYFYLFSVSLVLMRMGSLFYVLFMMNVQCLFEQCPSGFRSLFEIRVECFKISTSRLCCSQFEER